MWLLPFFPPVARAAAFMYYRTTYAGPPIPEEGPVLLVANHPNSLFDPVLVVAAARRPVRVLAKSPLFADRKIGWLMRAAGAIPVYRRSDDPGQIERNTEMFREVHAALGRGDAVGIFPEGTTHSEPGLVALKTGAARIALGAYPLAATAFPIVPMGLILRDKERFRSEALAVAGEPIAWAELAPRGIDDVEAVRELTSRIETGLREVTLNLEQWADRPLVECAVRIWEAEHDALVEAGARVARLTATTRLLAAVRRDRDPRWLALASAVAAHCRRLRVLGLRPSDLAADVGLARGLRWTASRLPLLIPVVAVPAVFGYLLFLIPRWLTRGIAAATRPGPEAIATHRLLSGIPVYALWILGLSAAAGLRSGPGAAVLALVGAPTIGILGTWIRERWRGAWEDARRFLLLRSRRELADQLRVAQTELAGRLRELYGHYAAREGLG